MSGLGAAHAASSDKEAEEVSQADALPFDDRHLPTFFPEQERLDRPTLRTKLNDAEYYIRRSGKRGKCVIFNYKVFQIQTGLMERTGTDQDVTDLTLRFSELGFEIILYSDLTRARTLDELQKLGEQDYSQDDCFVCWILTHGIEQGYLYTFDGGKMTEENFMSPFRENKGLLGKPKLFFIQACRGDRVDKGKSATFDRADSCAPTCRIPTYADFLVAYSTVPGYLSWSHRVKGSWFVQAVCCVLEKSSGSEDLFALLTEACRIVALSREAHKPDNDYLDGAKQVPFVTSTLTRRVRLPKIRQT
ncbi:caspase-1-like [Haemaphysalis longicornis]